MSIMRSKMKNQTKANQIGSIVEYVSGNREDVTGIFFAFKQKKKYAGFRHHVLT